ncbi:MAG: 6-bladed beta-propeller [Acidobacteriota bacterium]
MRTTDARCPLALAVCFLVAAAACRGDDGAVDPPAVASRPEVTVDGNTTTVHNPATGMWNGPRALHEEASIGAAAGDEAYLLGGVSAVTATDDRIYVADFQTVNVRVYDRHGTHLLDIGGEGNGPGEFRRPWALGVAPDGRLMVRDQLQRRVHVFDSDGELVDDWPSERGIRSTVGNDGSVYVMREDIFPNAANRVTASFMAYAPDGSSGDWVDFPDQVPTPAVDTTSDDNAPPRQMRVGLELMAVYLGIGADWRSTRWVPFAPRVVNEVAADGSMVSGRADTYRFEVRRPDGSVLIVDREWQPVPVAPGEADWQTRRLTAMWRAAVNEEWAWVGDPVPPFKGAYRAIVPTRDGAFWVVREAPGERVAQCNEDPADYYGFEEAPCWRQPYIADVFDEEGQFLGDVGMPAGIRCQVQPFIRGDTVIALLEDANGVAYVKRYRLVPAR